MIDAFLRIKGAGADQTVKLRTQQLTIGRHGTNKLILEESMASRFHCVIERGLEGNYILRDLQSSNGTLLNGQRVLSAALKDGDVIAIGGVQMTVVLPETPKPGGAAPLPEAAPPAPPVVDELEVVSDAVDELEIIEEQRDVGTTAAGTPLATLRKTADAMLEKSFDIDAIGLTNLRGKSLHEGGSGATAPSETAILLQLILLICFRGHATDIHLEPREDDFLLRIRMDGNLLDIVALPREPGGRLAALVKVLCELDTTQRTIVQEGHFSSRVPLARPGGGAAAGPQTRRVDYRVSFVPSLHGQKLVIRIFDAANAPLLINDLHLPRPVASQISEELTRDAGLILVCGPTGSGKTTTLYSLLRTCGSSFRNIVTIEDPVEVQIEGATQLPVDEEHGKSFAALLRSVLRQDPDVIMVGEIRDSETARIALQAAMTGHLVLSTIHTRDTVGTVYRLLDLGVEPFMVSQGLHLVLAQRLVRTLCLSCRRAFAPSPEDLRRMGASGVNVQKIYAPVGCPKCLGTGFHNRRAFFEFLSATDKLRDLIIRSPGISEMQQAVGDDFISLAHHGFELVAQGLTSIDEVDRAIGR